MQKLVNAREETEKKITCSVLVGMEISAAITEKPIEVTQKH